MTLPPDLNLPLHIDRFNSDNKRERELYIRELVRALEKSYQEIAENVNGYYGNSFLEGAQEYTPVVTGTTGTNGAETYSIQEGWYFRQGLMVDVWVDLEFTGHTGTGDTQISLPYTSAVTTNAPFQGIMIAGTIAYTANYTQISWNVGSDSLVADVLESGSGQTTQNLPLAAAGKFQGHLRYIGQRDE